MDGAGYAEREGRAWGRSKSNQMRSDHLNTYNGIEKYKLINVPGFMSLPNICHPWDNIDVKYIKGYDGQEHTFSLHCYPIDHLDFAGLVPPQVVSEPASRPPNMGNQNRTL